MDFAFTYLLQRFFYRIFEFFQHWYIGGSQVIGRQFMAAIAVADRTIAFRITLRHFFEPLYRDYTIIGRILGVAFRSARLSMGVVVYAVLAAIFLAIYIAWLAIPFIIFYYAAETL